MDSRVSTTQLAYSTLALWSGLLAIPRRMSQEVYSQENLPTWRPLGCGQVCHEPLSWCEVVKVTTVLGASHAPSVKMGMRVSTSQGYHKELLNSDAAMFCARIKVRFQNLFSFLPSSPPFLPFYFLVFYFQIHVSVGGRVTPIASRAPLDQQRLPVCASPQSKIAPWAESKGWTTGPVDSLGIRCHLSPEERAG